MTVEDSSRTTVGSRYLGDGFRNEPDFRGDAPTFDPPSSPVALLEPEPTVTVAKRTPAPNLDYVFDDPADGEPGRDRMLVHGLWELLLALALAGVAYLLYREQSAAFSGEGLRTLLLSASILGAFAASAAIALRAGVPNLAVGAVGVAAGLYFAHNSGDGVLRPALIVLGACAAVGLVQGLVVVGLQVPGWAVSLGVGLGLLVWAQSQSAVTVTGGYDPLPHAYYWFGGFCGLSIVAGLVALVPSLRRSFGRFRPVVDPARRRGVVAAVIALAATVVSTILAGVGGVLTVLVTDHASSSDGLEITALALGAALLGGTSAYGRRGGIFGTVLAVGLLTVVGEYATATQRPWNPAALAAVAIGVGLAATRLVERFGRPEPADDDAEEHDWVPKSHAATAGGATGAAVGEDGLVWPSSSSSSTATTTTGGLWASDEAWGSSERR